MLYINLAYSRLFDSPYGALLAAANGTRIAAPSAEMMKLVHKQGFIHNATFWFLYTQI